MYGGQSEVLPSTELSFEGAARACGELDLVFGAGFFGVLFEGQGDELVDEFAEGNAAGFPELRVHADGSEAGDGVHFVEIDFAAFFLQEKIDAGHTAEFEGAKRLDGVVLDFLHLRGLEVGGNQELRAFFQIFCGVVVKFAVGDDFAGDRGFPIVIAEDGNFDFARDHAALDENFHREFGGEIQGWREFLARVHFGHADGRAERGGFDEHGIRKFFFNRDLDVPRIAFPFVAVDGDPRYDGDFRDLKQALGDVFIHADGGTEDAGADKRQSCQLEQALDGSVFAKGAVHHGENHVDALAAAAAVQFYEGGVGGVRGHHDALATLQHFGQHFLRAGADQPVALFADADGHGFVLVGVETPNYGCGRDEGDFVFAGTAAEEDANAESFLVIRGHESVSFRREVQQSKVISFQL